jgi:hypothetical protein
VQSGRLSGIDVARIVKKLAKRAGLDPAKYVGHSLRAGHATTAAIAGCHTITLEHRHSFLELIRAETVAYREYHAVQVRIQDFLRQNAG